jgi:hypothetical protein
MREISAAFEKQKTTGESSHEEFSLIKKLEGAVEEVGRVQRLGDNHKFAVEIGEYWKVREGETLW